VNDSSGWSTSNAGDVNGDGLDDLIVGARYAGLSSKVEAGKSFTEDDIGFSCVCFTA
jgi:hypothetical protein